MKNVLVIGGAGFLGAALASEFKNRGVSVRAFDLLAHPDPSIPTHLGDLPDWESAHRLRLSRAIVTIPFPSFSKFLSGRRFARLDGRWPYWVPLSVSLLAQGFPT